MTPPDRAYPRNQAQPISAENENENGGKEPKCAFDQMRANDTFEKAVKTLYEPFQEVLRPAGNMLHVPRRDSGEDDQADGNHPTDQHGIGDRETEAPSDFLGFLRQAVFLLFRNGPRLTLFGSAG